MAVSTLDLNSFKSSGVYTIEIDNSESILITTQTIRLVIGFSRTGPFNVPVFLNTKRSARRVFGEIDSFLERKGCFFHRTVEKCLEVGPVIALNLLSLNDNLSSADPDTIQYKSFSLNTVEHNGNLVDKLLSSFYNKERFWFPEVDSFLATRSTTDQNALLNFVNLSQNPISIIVLKSDTKGYDLPAIEWFGSGSVPAFIKNYDFISDYFIDVYVISGDFGASKYTQLSQDPTYSPFFTVDGLIKDQFVNFLNQPTVTTIAKFTGTFIPDFTDQTGADLFIESVINPNVRVTGLFCAVNKDALDDYVNSTAQVDTIGHNLVQILDNTLPTALNNTIDMLSYTSKIKDEYQYSEKTSFTYQTIAQSKVSNVAATSGFSGVWRGISFNGLSGNPSAISSSNLKQLNFNISLLTQSELSVLQNTAVSNLGVWQFNTYGVKTTISRVYSVTVNSTTGILTLVVDKEVSPDTFVDSSNNYEIIYAWDVFDLNAGNSFSDPVVSEIGSHIVFYAMEDSQTYKDIVSDNITDGDTMLIQASPRNYQYLKIYGNTIDLTSSFVNVTGATFKVNVKLIAIFDDSDLSLISDAAFGISYTEGGVLVTGNVVNFISLVGNLNASYPIILGSYNGNVAQMNSEDALGLSVGDYLVYVDGTRLTRINKIRTISSGILEITTYENFKVWDATTDPIVEKFTGIDKFVSTYTISNLNGFTLKDRQMPNNTNLRMNSIYSVLESTNLFSSLADKEMIEWRYIVDVFNHGLEPGSKSILSRLAKARQKAMVLANTPSIKEFINSTDPRFTDAVTASNPKPTLNTSYIATGGNLDLNPSFTYSLPSEANGGKFIGFFAPNLNIRTSAGSIISAPPAMYVSNNFIRKFLDGNPYAIVAGRRRGVIGDTEVLSLEYDFSQPDRDNIEPFGWNPIIRQSGQFLIYANQTGYQKTNTALNNLHVRDMLITVETAVEEILNNYVFEFNTPANRLEIESLVRNYLDQVILANGIFSYTVSMNTVNNNGEVIGQNAGIVDITVEPSRGMQKLINRITITKPGGATSSGFGV